jgi:ferric enterobactin receptor
MKSTVLVLLALGVFNAAPVMAQSGPPAAPAGEIRGVVVDAESNAPISAASVAVWSKADSSLVAGAIVRQDGTFRIEGLRPGAYYLRLTMIGYASQATPVINITAAAPRATLGNLKLVRQAVEVAAVEATADRTVIIAPDRNSYRVKDVAPAAANASDVLENVPAVQVDVDGKVSLRGNENVVVQINGRPSPIRGAQLAGFLKQMPANTIERIEVVPNPSAKQDPEGMAGIINIVMKQGVDLGTSGGFNGLATSEQRFSIGGNIGHQSGPIALNANYGFLSDERVMLGTNDRTRFGVSSSPLSVTEQDLSGETSMRSHNFGLNGDYSFSKRDVLSVNTQLNYRTMADGQLSAYNILNGTGSVVDTYDRFRDNDQKNVLGDAGVAFKRTIAAQKNEWSVETRFNRQDDTDYSLLYRLTGGTANLDNEINDLSSLTNQLTLQFDVTRELSKSVKLETGYKGNSRWMDRDFDASKDLQGTGNWQPSDLSNGLEFDEMVNAVYAVFSKAGKKFDYQGGLRGEYATRDFTLKNTGVDYPHNYWSLFPSALINYKMNDKTQTKLSYSRRVRRPGTQELNPFPQFFDLQNVFLGNPELDPEYTDAIEVSYQRSGVLGSLQVTPFYRRTTNVIRVEINTADTVSNREVTTISFKNLDHSSSWGADINTQWKLSKAFSGITGLNIFKIVTDGGSESNLSSNAISWQARFNGTYAVNPTTAIIGGGFYRAPTNIERGRFAGMAGTNLAVRKTFNNNKLTAIVRMQDMLHTAKFRVNVRNDDIAQLTTREFNSRQLVMSMQYTFGQTPRLRQRRPDDQPAPSSNPFGS